MSIFMNLQMNANQRKYIKQIANISRQPNPVYKYKLVSTKKVSGHVVLCWTVTPLDTLFEENGRKYTMKERLNSDGHVVHQDRVYDFTPHWTTSDILPENICQSYSVEMPRK